MHQLKEVLARLRVGEPERAIARSGVIGRDKLASLRALANQHGWLDVRNPLPTEAEIAAVVGQHKRARSTVSSAELVATRLPAGSLRPWATATLAVAAWPRPSGTMKAMLAS